MDSFKVFFLCEDSLSPNHAIALKDKLVLNCRTKVDIDAHFFEYARLCHPRLRANATQQALASEMIIVTARGTEAVPEFVQNWMNQLGGLCLEKIVCAEFLLAPPIEQATTFHRFIDRWASQSGGFLFSNLYPASHPRIPQTASAEACVIE
jgi:hypothetical protein